MGGSGASKGTSETTNKIPAELSGLTSKTAGRIDYAQDQPGFDVSQYGKPNVQNIPGLAGGQQQAIQQAYGVGTPSIGTTGAYQSLQAAPEYAKQSSMPYAGQANPYASQSGRATGGTLATDPSIAAAYNAFRESTMPDIQSQYGLMGLGRSSLQGDAIARGAASQLLPVTQQALAREQAANEARIGRETGAAESRIGRETGAAESQFGRQVSTALNTAGQYAGLGQQDVNQRLASLNALMQTGGLERGVGQEEAAAEQQDILRRQALAEQGTFGVLGQLPSTLGQTVASKSSGGGK